MRRHPVDLDTLLAVLDEPRSAGDLAAYFEPRRPAGTPPRHPGSRFEFLAGGGDHPEVVNIVTAEDLVAVSTLGVDVPGDVALALLEGDLGTDVGRHLTHVPPDVGIGDPAAVDLVATAGPARVAWDLLAEFPGMSWVITNKLLARKRPRLLPVYDRVVRCAFGDPGDLWTWLLALFADGRLDQQVLAARDRASVSPAVSALRLLDVIVWMRHRPDHLNSRCPGPRW